MKQFKAFFHFTAFERECDLNSLRSNSILHILRGTGQCHGPELSKSKPAISGPA
ncbi:hypothetical protein [Comamonas sp.]|uniref:hypothetical protein n=1 Tax=Comamonas sp. TaxID=34028 RepID=UPI002647FF06|nr:hypothetical protein [Comamonas sp.]MDN5538537.1 hypothetical protein [Comamonas sp.]